MGETNPLFQVKVCVDDTKKVCKDVIDTRCRTGEKIECKEDVREECRTVYNEVCKYEKKKVCKMVYEKVCEPTPYKPTYKYRKPENVCKKIPTEKCDYKVRLY